MGFNQTIREEFKEFPDEDTLSQNKRIIELKLIIEEIVNTYNSKLTTKILYAQRFIVVFDFEKSRSVAYSDEISNISFLSDFAKVFDLAERFEREGFLK